MSHDGEAIFGAQAVAAMVAQAFVEPDVDRLLDTAVTVIPGDCQIRRVHEDVRGWAARDGDWRTTLDRLREKWGYSVFQGGCHMLPNHAVIVLALAYGKSDFDEAMMVVNTAGYDTDCNSGNVGCILGVAGGLDGLARGVDWRGPVADRMIVPTADAGSVITDAVQETDALEAMALRLRGEAVPARAGRFHFGDRGSVQGFLGEGAEVAHTDAGLRIRAGAGGGSAGTATWIPPESRGGGGYMIQASPTLWPGQTLVAEISGSGDARLFVDALVGDEVKRVASGPVSGKARWRPEVPESALIERVGVELPGGGEAVLRSLDWEGTPSAELAPVGPSGVWVSAVADLGFWHGIHAVQNAGTGLALTGCGEWTDVALRGVAYANLAEAYGLAVRVQGLRRYAAVEVLRGGGARIVTRFDGEETVLTHSDAGGGLARRVAVEVRVTGNRIEAIVDGSTLAAELPPALDRGGIGLVVTEGAASYPELSVGPV